MDTALTKELRMAAAGQERTWQAKLEIRAAEEIEQLEKRVKELEQSKARNENDPDMAFDAELGWLHKDSLAVLNELRQRLGNLYEKLELVEGVLELIVERAEVVWQTACQNRDFLGSISDNSIKAIAIIRELRKEPTESSDHRPKALLKTLDIWKDVSNAPAEISPGDASP